MYGPPILKSCYKFLRIGGTYTEAFQVVQLVKNLPAMQETPFFFLFYLFLLVGG